MILRPELAEAQRKLAALSNNELVSRMADTVIAIAYRRDVQPTQVLEDAIESIGFTPEQWDNIIRPTLARELDGRKMDGETREAETP